MLVGIRRKLKIIYMKYQLDQMMNGIKVHILLLVHMNRDPLVLDCLSRSVERAVSEEDRLLTWLVAGVVDVHELVVVSPQLVIAMRDMKQESLSARPASFESTVFIGCQNGASSSGVVISPNPALHFGSRQRLTTDRIEHKATQRARATLGSHHQCQVTLPDARELDHVVAITEFRIMTGDEEIKSRLDLFRHGDRLVSFVIVHRLGQVHRPAV